jgi:hypothetical protein
VIAALAASPASAAPAARASPTTIWGYSFVEQFAHDGIRSFVHRAEGVRIDLTMIQDAPPEVAAVYVDDEISLFDSLFTLKRTGYPGQTTRYIECPPEMRPVYAEKKIGESTFRYFRTYANANFVAGVSDPELATQRLLKGFLYCETLQTIFEIELFFPLEEKDGSSAFLEHLACPLSLP